MTAQLQKTVNALAPEAKLTLWAKILIFWAVYPTIYFSGGLWVGGTVTVEDGQLRFEPNTVNRGFLANDVSYALRLAEIRGVRVEPGLATNIIVLTTDGGERRVRCYDAEKFAAAIGEAQALAA